MTNAKLSKTMIALMTQALDRRLRTADGNAYQIDVEGRWNTVQALVRRGMAVIEPREIIGASGETFQATGAWLTADALTCLTLAGLMPAEAPKTCPCCGVPEDEPCRDALLDLIAEEPFAVEDVEHRMYVGILRDDAKDMGLVGADNVRESIRNNAPRGQRPTRLEDGTVRVDYSWFVPQRPAAEEAPTGSMAGLPSAGAQRATNAALTADYRTEAAGLLGTGERWVKHMQVFSNPETVEDIDRESALDMIVMALRAPVAWSITPSVTGGLNLVSPIGDTVYWMEPVAEEPVVTRVPEHEGYDTLGDGDQWGEDFHLLVNGERVGGSYFCSADTVQDGERWASWGPAGLSMRHATREAAEAVQVAAWKNGAPVAADKPAPAAEAVEEDVKPTRDTVYLCALAEQVSGYTMEGTHVRADYVGEAIRMARRTDADSLVAYVGTQGIIRVRSMLFIPLALVPTAKAPEASLNEGSILAASEAAAVALAKTLVPQGERVTSQYTDGKRSETFPVTRADAVGEAASLLRGGARYSYGDGVLVVRVTGGPTLRLTRAA
ncbi:hypothetical protein ACH4S8_38005 [Streptomyces sp. NPDC021080]|uniref:hypothetical protein n=1 Tax=Streptomyces sp. NPDC021080 TaxID=3365110 RepID=UPI00379D52B8